MSDSRERVIDAAATLFLGESFHKIGIAEICEVAHVNKGTFYHFFPSKLDLLLEVIDRYVTECGRDFMQVAQSNEDPRRKLMSLFAVPRSRNQAWKAAHGAASGCFIGNIILEMASTEPIVRERVDRAISELTRILHPVVADYLRSDGDRSEDGTPDDIPQVAELLMALIQGAQVQAKAKNDPSIFDKYAVMAPAIISGARSGTSASPY